MKSAEAAPVPTPPAPRFAAWADCSTCKQRFTGQVKLRLAIVLWTKYARAVEMGTIRIAAAGTYTTALEAAGEHTEAVRLLRGVLGVETRVLGPGHRTTLTCASNLTVSLMRLGECAETAVLFALTRLGEQAEAETVGRCALERQRRVLDRDHRETLTTAGNLVLSLLGQGKYAEAAEIERKILMLRTRVLGAEHESTMTTVTNLAGLFSQCGKKGGGGEKSSTIRWLWLGARSVRLTRLPRAYSTAFARSTPRRDDAFLFKSTDGPSASRCATAESLCATFIHLISAFAFTFITPRSPPLAPLVLRVLARQSAFARINIDNRG